MLVHECPAKLLPLFSTEIANDAAIAPFVADGHTILALNMSVIQYARQRGYPWVCLEHFVDLDTIYQAGVAAIELSRKWFEDCSEMFVLDSICWPALDRDAMYFFWKQTVMAALLMESFLQRGGQTVSFLTPSQQVPAVYYFKSYVWRDVVLNYLGSSNRSRAASGPILQEVKRIAGHLSPLKPYVPVPKPGDNGERFLGSQSRNNGQVSASNRAIAFAFNAGELYRFVPIIQDTAKSIDREVRVYILENDAVRASSLSREIGAQVLPGPISGKVDSRAASHFLHAFSEARRHLKGTPWSVFLDIQYHFEYYCRSRWPILLDLLHKWSFLWQLDKPASLVVSSLMDAESQLPAVAANRMSIPTFALPHARNHRVQNLLHAQYPLYDYVPARFLMERAGIAPDRIIPCSNIISDYSYPTQIEPSEATSSNPKKLRLLVLLCPCYNGVSQEDEIIMPRALLLRHIENVRFLAAPPPDIADSVEIKFKLYPLYPELEVFDLAGVDADRFTLPIESHLLDFLPHFDIVVDVNCASASAVLLSFREQKPLIFLWDSFNKWPDTNYEVLLEGGLHVTHEDTFWNTVRRTISDQDFLHDLTERSRSFKKRYFDYNSYPTLAEVLRNKLKTGLAGPFSMRPKYWSELSQGETLRAVLSKKGTSSHCWPQLYYIAKYYSNLQRKHSFRYSSYTQELLTLIHQKISDNQLYSAFLTSINPILRMIDMSADLTCSWAHGDFSPETIYCQHDNFKELGWEWSTSAAPLTSDLLDLYIRSAEHVLGIPTDRALASLLMDTCPQLRPLNTIIQSLWCAERADWRRIQTILCYTLIRYVGRVLAQKGHAGLNSIRIYVEAALSIAQTSTTPSSLMQLLRENKSWPNTEITRHVRTSIVVPTVNRANSLKNTLSSLCNQTHPPEEFEIVVVDNGSTDSTKAVVEAMGVSSRIHNLRYIHEPEPGLLSGRHRGALEAFGEIIVFIDDDIEATPGWLDAIVASFRDPAVHIVGGPSFPKFETSPPDWLSRYCSSPNGHLSCFSLSLIDLGDRLHEIDPIYVFGLNYAIRANTLFDLNGFHPDCIPQHLQMYQGDGETGLSFKAKERGLKAVYAPGAAVYHCIPKERLTVEYFKKRFFYQGVCDSYTLIRRKGGFSNIEIPSHVTSTPWDIHEQINNAYVDGFAFHQKWARSNRRLQEWIMRDNYFEYKLPDLSSGMYEIASHRDSSTKAIELAAADPSRQLITSARERLSQAHIEIKRGNFASALRLLEELDALIPGLEGLKELRSYCHCMLKSSTSSPS